MTGQSLVDDSNSIPGSAAPGSGSNSRAFIEEYSALVRVRAPDTPDSRQTASSGSCSPADLENSSKSQPTPNESSNADPIRCVCIGCLRISRRVSSIRTDLRLPCRVSNCGWTCTRFPHRSRNKHEKEHFSHEGKYQCNASNCTRSFKRWDDLIRHTSNKHCLNPKRYPCPEIGCKYSGDNGFSRKDKMKSHHKNEHEGKPKIFLARPAGVPQAILPAPEGRFANIETSGRADDYGATGRENKRVRRS